MSWFGGLLWASWNVLLVAAPFVLLGLFTGGVLHVVLSRHMVERWMGREGLSGVVAAALFGMPLPMCSCGVVPVALTLRRKGASRPAAASFLISTPETGVDSILLTWMPPGVVVPEVTEVRRVGTCGTTTPGIVEAAPRQSAHALACFRNPHVFPGVRPPARSSRR